MSEPTEPRVAELLRSKKIKVRPVLGHRLVEQVGSRAWKRPRVAFSSRLYRQYRIADPWDPESKPDGGDGIGLGPVSLRFEEKREVAPHLKPKEPEGAKTAQAAAVDPLAKYRRPTPTPQSEAPKAPAPAPPPPAPPPRPAPAPSGEFGRTERPALKGPLPQRPDMPPTQPGAPAASGAPKAPPAPSPPPGSPRPPAPPAPPRPPAPPAPAAKAGPPPPAPRPVPGSGPPVDPASVPRPQVSLGPPRAAPPRKSAPAAGRSAAPAPPRKAVPADLPRSLPPVARPGGGGGGAAPSLRPAIQRAAPRGPLMSIDEEPEVVEIRNLPPPPPPAPIAPPEILELESPRPAPALAPAPKPVNRSIPTGPAGLDDLFGMAQEGGRIRRSKKEAPTGEAPRKE